MIFREDAAGKKRKMSGDIVEKISQIQYVYKIVYTFGGNYMAVRQITDSEKEIVKTNQRDSNGPLHCFISGEIINESTDEIEYDHITAFSYDGPSDIINVRVVLKEYNRRKKDQTLFDIRDQINIQRLYEKKQNNVKLQDILEYKGEKNINTKIEINEKQIIISDGTEIRNFNLLHDQILGVDYFYCRVPIKWIRKMIKKDYSQELLIKKGFLNYQSI
jgi:hypothetical protein